MPSVKTLEKKQAIVSDLSDKLTSSVAGVLVDYKGISVADDTNLRRDLREAGVTYFVVKNTLLERAAEKAGFDELKTYLSGTSALAISESDPVAAAKVLSKYADSSKGKFTVKAGFVDGSVIDAAKVSELGKLPSKEGLLSMLLSVLTGNVRGLACALNAIAEKQGGGVAAEESAAPAEPEVVAEAAPAEAEEETAAPAEETAEAEPVAAEEPAAE